MQNLRIVVLVENTVSTEDLVAEHGLSVWIETGGKRFLFDTGQGGALAVNARVLGIPLETADAVCLSHGHYDHTGGLIHVLIKGRPTVYRHPASLDMKYSCRVMGKARDIGMPPEVRELVRSAPDLRWIQGPTEVWPGMFLTGPVPRLTGFEDTGGAFYSDEACRMPDDLPDDQAAFLDTDEGLVVILGCAHAGVINTLRYILEISGKTRIRAVMGGMHLLFAGERRMRETVSALRELDVRALYPAHCTGSEAAGRLSREFPGQCFPFPAGMVLELGG